MESIKKVKGITWQMINEAALDFYGVNFDQSQLVTRLHLTTHFKDQVIAVSFKDVSEYLKSLSMCWHSFYLQVIVGL